MLRNYFKTSFRNLARNKSYAFINIAGLATGIAVCMMIFIFIQFQTSFDAFHAKKDRVYRVLTAYHHADAANVAYGKSVPYPLPAGLKINFPQAEAVAPVYASHNDELIVPDDNGAPLKKFKEENGVFFTQPSFFDMFDFPLLAGSYASLKDPNNVLITKETAERYFGEWRAAIGKTIVLKSGGFMFAHGTDILKVSGVLASIPANTDFQLKLVVAYGTGDTDWMEKNTHWDESTPEFGCYVLLPPAMQAARFNQQLREYSLKVRSAENQDSHILQPLDDVHYDVATGNYSNKTISRKLLNVLWLIAAFILAIACINFINLSTAQAVNRSKEVGVRKVLGSSRSQLRAQFILETFLLVVVSVVLAVIFSVLALPSVNQLLQLSVSLNLVKDPSISLFLLTIIVAVTVLAGFYPSIVLSRFNPVNALKSKMGAGPAKGISLRRGLVIFQFVIAQVLIISTFVIVKQMNYFMNQPLGFDKNAIVNVPFRTDSARISKIDYIQQQLLSINGVQSVSFSSNTPVEETNDTWYPFQFDHAKKETDFHSILKFGDNEYVPTYKLTLTAGRNLQPSSMVREFLVNESLVSSLGLKNPEEILNKDLRLWGVMNGPVVGVLKDFNDRSFRHDLAPLIITTNVTMYNQAGIKLATTNIASTMQSIKQMWEKTFPDFVFQYRFLDDKIESFYRQEEQLAQLYTVFSALAIFLSCLGLYGLASFMAVQRIKEVGIRKVLGATTANIVFLFTREFVVLVAIAFAIATPIAWYFMHKWLQDYVYRIDISWWLFAASGVIAIVIALATISFQAIKAALANPVKSLGAE